MANFARVSIPISVSASGDTALVAAEAGVAFRVIEYTLVCAAAVSVKFKKGSTDLTGAMPFAANGGVSTAPDRDGLFETGKNQALNINLSGAVAVAGHLVYERVG